MVERLENENTFWTPVAATLNANRYEWFKFFGSADIEGIWSPPDATVRSDYVDQNYVGGLPADDVNEPTATTGEMELQDFNAFRGRTNRGEDLGEVDILAILEGRRKQGRSSVLHDVIVRRLGERLQGLRYTVRFDPNSVDILAEKQAFAGILEVKTIGPRNISTRLRLGTGQLIEYRRRFENQAHRRPMCILVVGVEALPEPFSYWRDVLEHGAEIGSIGYSVGGFVAHTQGPLEREIAAVPG